MSVEAMAMVLHHSKAKGTDKVILLGIANHQGDGGAWPRVDTLAAYANVEERAAQKAIRRLELSGEVVVHLNGGGTQNTRNNYRPNRYDVAVACPITCDRTMNHRPIKLPKAPADLWKTGVSAETGVSATTPLGVSATTPLGVSATTPEPDTQPSIEHSGSETASLTTARGPSRALCVVCFLPEAECQRRSATSGHGFEARVLGAHQTKRSDEKAG